MTTTEIQPRFIFGIRTDVKNNISYITDQTILYPVGSVLTLHNVGQKHQYYIRMHDKTKLINVLCVSLNRKFVAVGEVGERPSFSIYDLTTAKRKRSGMAPHEITATEFVSIAFTQDNKFLVAVTGDPDWMLIIYNLENGKISTTMKATNPGQATSVWQVLTNIVDNNLLCIIGPGLFRLLRFTEGQWKQFGYQKGDIHPILCACWLASERIMAGTADGKLLVIELGEYRGSHKPSDTNIISCKFKDELLTATESISNEEECAISVMIYFPKGFACTYGPDTVVIYETLDLMTYRKRKLVKFPISEFSPLLEGPESKMEVQTLSVNPSQDMIIATTNLSQIYAGNIVSTDLEQTTEGVFELVGEPLHHGPVTGLDVCAWKPIYVTCGEDKTLRMWNYETTSQIFCREYQEDVCSVSLHPTGHYLLAGFSDKLRYMDIQTADVIVCHDFAIRSCKECCFSHGGHLFAAVSGNVIQIFSSISFEAVHSLKGHNGKVRCIIWSLDDSKLVSCGQEGAVYEWDIVTGKRTSESVLKMCSYIGITISADGNNIYASSADELLKEIFESQVNRVVECHMILNSLVMSRSGMMLFAGSSQGSILSFKYPLTVPGEWQEFQMQSKVITKVKLTYDDLSMISCSEDGTICQWKLLHAEGKAVKLDKDFAYTTEVLISVDELNSKITSIKDLKQRIEEMQSEHAYQLRIKEITHSELMKETHEGYLKQIEDLKERIEQSSNDHIQQVTIMNNDRENERTVHEKFVHKLESTYDAKLIVEYNRYEALEKKLDETIQDYEMKLRALEIDKQQALEQLTENFKAQIHERNVQLEELREEARHQVKEHEEIKQQVEDDADREIVELRSHYEKLLKDEKETNLKLRGEAGILKKKLISTQKEIEDCKHHIQALQIEKDKFQQMIKSLEKDITDLKKEIIERDETIQDKEKRIYDLKKKNQELEKFKFVLNYKIKELKNQIEPREREIKEKKEQIQDMETELEKLQRKNTTLQLHIDDLNHRVTATDHELTTEKHRCRDLDALLKRIRVDLHNTSGLIQQPGQLKKAVKEIYHKHGEDPEMLLNKAKDREAQAEFERQREHLERMIATLKRQLQAGASLQAGNTMKLMEENVFLVNEINSLRKELKMARVHIHEMESLLGLTQKYMTPKEMKQKLKTAIKTKEEIEEEFEKQIEDREKIISNQRDEIHRLFRKIKKLEGEI